MQIQMLVLNIQDLWETMENLWALPMFTVFTSPIQKIAQKENTKQASLLVSLLIILISAIQLSETILLHSDPAQRDTTYKTAKDYFSTQQALLTEISNS